jgi:predicted O-methyltransferase YrrM
MLKRIVRVLSRPHRIPMKIYSRLETVGIGFRYPLQKYEREQASMFKALGLDYEASKQTLAAIYRADPDLQDPYSSCHHNVFAALSLTQEPKSILEIGTHTGKGAVLLSKLFPSAKIDTFDLPDDHPVFVQTYQRDVETARSTFLSKRDALLESEPNVTFEQTDSTTLTLAREPRYDFIWVDGAHGSPVAVIDIANSVRLLNDGGVIACDDVFTNPGKNDRNYESSASFDTIQQLASAGLIDYGLVYKRTAKPHAHPLRRKYVAILWRSNTQATGEDS